MGKIRKSYPKASEVLSKGTWSDLIQRKRFEHIFSGLGEDKEGEQLQDSEKAQEVNSDDIEVRIAFSSKIVHMHFVILTFFL